MLVNIKRFANLRFFAAVAVIAVPTGAIAASETAGPELFTSAVLSSSPFFSFPLPVHGTVPPSVSTSFVSRDFDGHVQMRTEVREPGVIFRTAAGDLVLQEGPLLPIRRRGGMLSWDVGSGRRKVSVATYALTGKQEGEGNIRADGLLLGASGEVGLPVAGARIRGFVLSGREESVSFSEWRRLGERQGDTAGVRGSVEAIPGVLHADAEVTFSRYDGDTGDAEAPLEDSAWRMQAAGAPWGCRYALAYEYAGPRYTLMEEGTAKRDREGYSLSTVLPFGRHHGLNISLSRYNDNVEGVPKVATTYTWEGGFDYRYSGFRSFPIGMGYRKSRILREASSAPREAEGETISGNVGILAGMLELGLKGTWHERTDLVHNLRELSSSSVTLAPRVAAAGFVFTPDVVLGKSQNFYNDTTTRSVAFNLRVAPGGKTPGPDVKGGIRRETLTTPFLERETTGAALRIAYPLQGISRRLPPFLGIRGDYSSVRESGMDRRDSMMSLLLTLGNDRSIL